MEQRTNLGRFDNKVALVTGAGSGMGRAIALRLATEGAVVVGADLNSEGVGETIGLLDADASGMIESHQLDVRDVEACRAAVAHVVDAHGQLDVLGNVAGVHPHLGPISDVDEAMFDLYIDVNLKGVFFLSQAAVPHLLESSGNIVNIASNAGLQGLAYCAAYCASKGGVVQLTKSMAMEFVKQSIRINAIAPGGTQTALVDTIDFSPDVDFDLVARYTSPRGLDSPDAIAALFAHVASAEAANMHGSIIVADSGLTAG